MGRLPQAAEAEEWHGGVGGQSYMYHMHPNQANLLSSAVVEDSGLSLVVKIKLQIRLTGTVHGKGWGARLPSCPSAE